MTSGQDADNALCGDTLCRSHPAFIHQFVVDAFTAQHADEASKPIAVAFALVGLYLAVERQFSSRQIRLAHMKRARRSGFASWKRSSLQSEIVASTVGTAGPRAPKRHGVR